MAIDPDVQVLLDAMQAEIDAVKSEADANTELNDQQKAEIAALQGELQSHTHNTTPPDPDPGPPPDPDPDPDPDPGPTPPPTGVHQKPSTYLQIRTDGRQLTVNPGDNLRTMAQNAQPHDRYTWKAGTYGPGDIQFKVPTQHTAESGVEFKGIGGGKGVFVTESGVAGSPFETDDAVTIFDGFNFENLGTGGSNNNFAAFRLANGHHIIRNCVVNGSRQGILGQIYSGNWQSPTFEDGINGRDIELDNCQFLDCGKDGLAHGVYTRCRRFWIEDTTIQYNRATAPFNGGFHDVKHLGSVLDIVNCTIGHPGSDVQVPVDVSGHQGAVRLVGSTIIKGRMANTRSGPNRFFFNYLLQRLGDNWAPDEWIIDDCVLETYFEDFKNISHTTKWCNTGNPGAFQVTNTTFEHKASRGNFDVRPVPNVNNGNNTFNGNVLH